MKPIKNKIRVDHFPQVPGESFFVDVKDEEQAFLVYNVLADQHLFLYDQGIIEDYSNAILVQMWDEDDQEWVDYHNEEEGMDWKEIVEQYFSKES